MAGVCNYVHMQAPQAEQLRLKSKRVSAICTYALTFGVL